MEIASSFKPQSNVTRTQWASYLEDIYRKIFARIYADTRVISPAQQLIGLVEENEKAVELGEIFVEFTQQFFDPNGFFSHADAAHAAPELAKLYQQLMAASPFPYGNSLVTRLFFTLMGEMRGFREKLGGIDFRRLNSEEVEWLRGEKTTLAQLTSVFLAAMHRQRDPVYPVQLAHYPYWSDNTISLHGMRFLQLSSRSRAVNLWQICEPEAVIVLSNGKLVLRGVFTQLLEKYQQTGGLMGKWKIPKSAWIGELQGVEAKFKTPHFVDYQDVSEAAPPICLSLHPFTHLSYAQHKRLEHYLRNEYAADVMALKDKKLLKQVVENLADSPQAVEMIEMAAERIRLIAKSLRESIEAEINAKPLAVCKKGKPRLVMTMGGSGSGKNSNQYFNTHFKTPEREIKPEYVFASLDEGRPNSDIYHVLIAAGHHADDYEAVHLWADTRRNWLCEVARAKRMNVLYDGSGVEYAGRYDAIVKAFADAGYTTEVAAADCMLLVPEARREQFPQTAIDRIISRSGKAYNHYRTLPWRIAINKHIGFPASLLAAFQDTNLDKLVLVDNAGKAKEDKVIAELFKVSDAQLKKLKKAESLLQILDKEKLLPYGRSVQEIDEKNTGFLAARIQGKNHLLVIANIERFIDVLEKGQLNPNAHGEQALAWLKRTASFLIDRIDKPEGISTVPPKVPTKQAKNKDAPRSNYLRLNSGEV
jgi:hypothetical protein